MIETNTLDNLLHLMTPRTLALLVQDLANSARRREAIAALHELIALVGWANAKRILRKRETWRLPNLERPARCHPRQV